MSDSSKFTAIVLAGDRGPDDPVAKSQGASCKALSKVGGRELLLRVLDVLLASPNIKRTCIVGPAVEHIDSCPELERLLTNKSVLWIPPSRTPCTSAQAALESVGDSHPLLITTADHGFLDQKVLQDFLNAAESHDADTVTGLVRYDQVMSEFPQGKRTALRFKGNSYCGCNLFAIRTSDGSKAVSYWRQVETLRKTPWRIASVVGIPTLLSFVLGRLTADAAMLALSKKMGAKVGYVEVPHARAAIDIDTPADCELVENVLSERS
ncbi:MAG: GTP:adenosylcobinamide-phosphate guanylyltransferase [Planctomycetota bacterium]|jgi:GTP:adenosylcobinamide-phosphate guanylyltransferase